MSVQAEVTLTAAREIRKNLRSGKGIAMFVLFVLGGLVPRLIGLAIERFLSSHGAEHLPPEVVREGWMKFLTGQYGEETAKYLVDCPKVMWGLFTGTLLFVPLIIMVVGFDTISGELQHRTFRYVTPRARRPALLAGKALGIWAVVALMILVLHATSWLLAIATGSDPAGAILSWGIRLWVFAVIYGAAYVGLGTLFSSLFRIPVVSLFVGIGAVLIMGILGLALEATEKAQAVTYLLPRTYEKWLLAPDPTHVAGGIAVLLAWGAVCLLVSGELLARRDV